MRMCEVAGGRGERELVGWKRKGAFRRTDLLLLCVASQLLHHHTKDNKRIFGSAVVRNVTMNQGFGIDGMLLCMSQAYARSIEIDNDSITSVVPVV